MSTHPVSRRHAVWALAVAAASLSRATDLLAGGTHPDARWYAKAREMQLLAESWGDQSYGAAVVLGDELLGLGPSRVVRDRDPDAHAERVAIREAQRRLGRRDLAGAMLYSTSRPCRVCEAAAAEAGLSRMFHGPALTDAGPPRP